MSDNNEVTLDPEVERELDSALSEEQIIGAYGTGESGQDKLPLVKSWFPDSENWDGKTDINETQAKNIAISRQLVKAFPELIVLEEFINEAIDDYEVLLTSVDGKARNEQVEILSAMFGAGTDDEDLARGAFAKILAGEEDSDE